MGKDNVVFHSVIWPALLLGASGKPAGKPGPLGELALPGEVVSSEFLTMEGKKFSSSRSVVIYVRDVLERYGADALRYYLAAAGPESSDTDFTWSQFVTRNNTELVAGWGNLVNRTVSMVEKNIGAIPPAGELLGPDHAALEGSRAAFGPIGALLARSQQKAALAEAMKVVAEANRYLSEQAPWKLKGDDEVARRDTVLHVALQLVDDAKTLLTPFLPGSSEQVHRMLGGTEVWSGQPELQEVDDLDGGPGYPVLMGDYDTEAVWESRPLRVGHQVAKPVPLFVKLDPSVVDEELARLEDAAP
jgi:methionyl-tRNA synthetase